MFNSLPVTHSCTYCIYKQPANTHTHTPSYTHPHPPASSPSAQIGFSITERRWDGGGGGGLGGGAAVGRKLFCHWHPTVILWLITPALRLNRDASIPGSMVLADMHRSASHIAPEVLQTSGDKVSLREKREEKKGEICPKHRTGDRTGVTLLPLGRTYLQALEKERKKKKNFARESRTVSRSERAAAAQITFSCLFSVCR